MTNDISIVIPTALLRAALICASTEKARYYLEGVYADPTGFIVSTDSRRMFVGAIDLEGIPPFQGWIIPRDAVKRALAGYKAEDITISPTRCGDIACQPVDGSFPDWRRVVPDAAPTGVAAQFNPDYVADMGKIGDALSGKRKDTSMPIHIHHNGENPTPVTFPAYPRAFAVLMPIRAAHTSPDSAWTDARNLIG